MGRYGAGIAIAAMLWSCGTERRPTVPPDQTVEGVRGAAEKPTEPHVEIGTCYELRAAERPKEDGSSDEKPDLAGLGPVAPYDGGLGPPITRRPVRVPNVRPGKPVVKGGLDGAIVRRVVRRYLGQIRSCYEQGLHDDPLLAGKVKIRWVVDPTGKVPAVRVTGIKRKVAACLEKVIRKLRFPAPEGGGSVIIEYPLQMRPDRVAGGELATSPSAVVEESQRVDCEGPIVAPPISRQLPELQSCFESLLEQDPKAVARVTALLSVDGRGEVTEVAVEEAGDPRIAACVGNGLSKVVLAAENRERKLACSVVLQNPEQDGLVTHALDLVINHDDIKLRGQRVADAYDIKSDQSERWVVDDLRRHLEISQRIPLVIEAHPTVDARIIERSVRTAEAAGFRTILFARAFGTTKSWRAVNPLATPDWGCRNPEAALSVRVSRDLNLYRQHYCGCRYSMAEEADRR